MIKFKKTSSKNSPKPAQALAYFEPSQISDTQIALSAYNAGEKLEKLLLSYWENTDFKDEILSEAVSQCQETSGFILQDIDFDIVKHILKGELPAGEAEGKLDGWYLDDCE
jgi:hypothetical protein